METEYKLIFANQSIDTKIKYKKLEKLKCIYFYRK